MSRPHSGRLLSSWHSWYKQVNGRLFSVVWELYKISRKILTNTNTLQCLMWYLNSFDSFFPVRTEKNKNIENAFQCCMSFDHSFLLWECLFMTPKFSADVNKWKNIEKRYWLVAIYNSRQYGPKTLWNSKFIFYY